MSTDHPQGNDHLNEAGQPSPSKSSDLVEHEVPGSGHTVLAENLRPDDSPALTLTPSEVIAKSESHTRRNLAYGAGVVLTAFYAATFTLYVTGVVKDLGLVIAGFSGLQTLTAAAFGFYFARPSNGN